MKRYGNLWEKVISWENLLLAARKACRRKRASPPVRRFHFDLEHELVTLQAELTAGCYRPGGFRTHWIDRPKRRLISAAPFRDRVVHHALINVLEPILERRFHPDSYACRKRKGTHAAARRLQYWMRRRRYALQCDIAKFFPSIDHAILKAEFRRIIKDSQLLCLMDLIVDHSNPQEDVKEWFPGDGLFDPVERRCGLPIGNLTSQWFANWMLNGLDHFVTSELGLGAYVRYCDDFTVLSDDKPELLAVKHSIRRYLDQRRLRLHERKAQIRPVVHGVTFVGYRVRPHCRTVRKSNVRAFRRRVRWMRRAYSQRRIGWPEVRQRLASWIGHARQADSEAMLRRLSEEWSFVRGDAEIEPCSARRLVEQQSAQPALGEPQQEHAGQPQQQHRRPLGPALLDIGHSGPGIALSTDGAREVQEESWHRSSAGFTKTSQMIPWSPRAVGVRPTFEATISRLLILVVLVLATPYLASASDLDIYTGRPRSAETIAEQPSPAPQSEAEQARREAIEAVLRRHLEPMREQTASDQDDDPTEDASDADDSKMPEPSEHAAERSGGDPETAAERQEEGDESEAEAGDDPADAASDLDGTNRAEPGEEGKPGDTAAPALDRAAMRSLRRELLSVATGRHESGHEAPEPESFILPSGRRVVAFPDASRPTRADQ